MLNKEKLMAQMGTMPSPYRHVSRSSLQSRPTTGDERLRSPSGRRFLDDALRLAGRFRRRETTSSVAVNGPEAMRFDICPECRGRLRVIEPSAFLCRSELLGFVLAVEKAQVLGQSEGGAA